MPWMLEVSGGGGSGLNRGVTVRRTADQSITTSTRTAISFNTETRDDGGFWASSPNPTRVTIPTGEGGWYQISGNLRWAAASGGLRQAEIFLNGTTLLDVNADTNPSSTLQTYTRVSRGYFLTAGDYVELTAFQSSGGSVNVVAAVEYSPWLSVVRVGIG